MHVLTTGQSLSQGLYSTPARTRRPQAGSRMLAFDWGPAGRVYTRLVPLVEGGYPHDGETPAGGIGRSLRAWTGRSVIVSRHGVSGQPYAGLAFGTAPFTDGLDQVRAAEALLDAEDRDQLVPAVVVTHGEADAVPAGTPTAYADSLTAWQADYDREIRAITGQTATVRLVIDQVSSFQPTSAIPTAQLAAARSNPDVVLMGPKYFLGYTPDRIHLTNRSSTVLGEYHAKVLRRLVAGQGWTPLSPTGITVCPPTRTVTVALHVPVPPVRLDTRSIPAAPGHGFSVVDGGATPATVTGVRVVGGRSLRLTLSRVPVGEVRVRYAASAPVVAAPRNALGETVGARGNVRDSDPTRGPLSGRALPNWLVHFDDPAVPAC